MSYMFPDIIPVRTVRAAIDGFVESLVMNYANNLEAFSQPVLQVLMWLERSLRASPWWTVVMAVVLIAWLPSRRVVLSLSIGALLCMIGVLGLWDAGMQTLALMIMAAGLSVLIGIPFGVMTARMNGLRAVMLPALDVMQIMPSFVYLIPVVMLFGMGKIPAIIATVIYVVSPLICLTDLGIRLVDQEVLEAARVFGANPRQQLTIIWRAVFAGFIQHHGRHQSEHDDGVVDGGDRLHDQCARFGL